MQRRDFLVISGAAALMPMAARAGNGVGTAYQPGMVEAALAEGKTVFLDFYTTWCGTCDRQERVINALKAENPAYGETITFIKVDWDQHSRSDLAQRLRIPRRSTLVVLRGDAEIGRLVAETAEDRIKGLLDAALTVSG